ncbi:MAG: hypothetical protein ACHQ0J_13310 [Candidatus Dormibacterales bacterium]
MKVDMAETIRLGQKSHVSLRYRELSFERSRKRWQKPSQGNAFYFGELSQGGGMTVQHDDQPTLERRVECMGDTPPSVVVNALANRKV